MTTTRNSLRDRVNRRARELEAQGRIAPRILPRPGGVRARTPGTTLWMVRIVSDGKRRTREEAAATFAQQPFATSAVEAGMSGAFYVWEIDEALDPRSK